MSGHPERNNRRNPWTHREDALLFEGMELTGNRDKKLWGYLKGLGVNRTYHAVKNRVKYLTLKQSKIKAEYTLPQGWGYY